MNRKAGTRDKARLLGGGEGQIWEWSGEEGTKLRVFGQRSEGEKSQEHGKRPTNLSTATVIPQLLFIGSTFCILVKLWKFITFKQVTVVFFVLWCYKAPIVARLRQFIHLHPSLSSHLIFLKLMAPLAQTLHHNHLTALWYNPIIHRLFAAGAIFSSPEDELCQQYATAARVFRGGNIRRKPYPNSSELSQLGTNYLSTTDKKVDSFVKTSFVCVAAAWMFLNFTTYNSLEAILGSNSIISVSYSACTIAFNWCHLTPAAQLTSNVIGSQVYTAATKRPVSVWFFLGNVL